MDYFYWSFPQKPKIFVFSQIVNDVNIELGIACSLYQILFFKSNDDWLQVNGKLNPQLFWDDDLHLSITGYQKLQLHYSTLFHRVIHLNQHHSI